jgi:hypothetical protein
METVDQKAFELCNILGSRLSGAEHFGYKFLVEPGRKYLKIIQCGTYDGEILTDGPRSVHAFVNKSTGDLYKPASWAQPAKGARYNLLADMEKLHIVADVYGTYLYKK